MHKILIAGNSRSGKNCWMLRLVGSRFLTETFPSKNIYKCDFDLYNFIFCNEKCFHNFNEKVEAAIIFIDNTKDILKQLSYWLSRIKDIVNMDKIIVVYSKSDLKSINSGIQMSSKDNINIMKPIEILDSMFYGELPRAIYK